VPNNIAPSNQFDLPSEQILFAIKTATNVAIVSNNPNCRDMFTFNNHPNKTVIGAINTATWVEEPMAIPMDKSILFFPATVTAVKCSAAFPNNGINITPMNNEGHPNA